MPSSLATSRSTPRYPLPDHLCRSAVRVPRGWSLAGFLGSMITCAVSAPKRGAVLSGLGERRGLHPPHVAYTVQRAIPSARGSATSPSPRRPARQSRNVDRDAIGCAIRLPLRTRLTPGRQALPGKPRSFGGGGSHAPCRYSCLHLPFRALQTGSPPAFDARGMLPYRYFHDCYPAPSASALYPIIIHAQSLDQ